MRDVLRHGRLVALAALLTFSSPYPAFAQSNDGIDNDGDGQIDEPDEYLGGSNDMGGMERICNATARVDACLTAHNMFCQQFGMPQFCALAEIGNHCNGGDPGQCRYYQDLMQADMACKYGDQAACNWVYAQPVIASFR